MLIYATVGFLITESRENPELNWLDGLWWAIVSMTTVGYGDLFPQTTAGRYLVGIPTMFFGCALVAQILSSMADRIIETQSKKRKGLGRMNLKGHIIIVCCPSIRKVEELVSEIRADASTHATPIVLIDSTLEELPEELTSLGVTFVRGEGEELNVLERANYQQAAQVILLSEAKKGKMSDLQNLAIVLLIESHAPHIRTVAEVLSPDKVKVFEKAGCDTVICLAAMSSKLIAQEIQDPGFSLVVHELSSNRDGKQIYIIPFSSSIRTYSELEYELRDKDALLIGISHSDENGGGPQKSTWYPKADFLLKESDRAIIIAENRPQYGALDC